MPSAAAFASSCQDNERHGSVAAIPLPIDPVVTRLRSVETRPHLKQQASAVVILPDPFGTVNQKAVALALCRSSMNNLQHLVQVADDSPELTIAVSRALFNQSSAADCSCSSKVLFQQASVICHTCTAPVLSGL